MSRKNDLFNAVKTAVLADRYFKTFDLWNRQFDDEMEGRINSMLFPALFMEFGTITMEEMARGSAKAKASISFHIGQKWIDRSPALLFTATDRLAGILDLMEGEEFVFVKRTETQEVGFDKIASWMVTYDVTYFEDNGQRELTKISGLNQSITVEISTPE
jgi:hypothetical protein